MKTRRYSSRHAAIASGISRMAKQYAIVVDAADECTRMAVPADRPTGLLAGLMIRAGTLKPLPAAPSKPRRGRPVGSGKKAVPA